MAPIILALLREGATPERYASVAGQAGLVPMPFINGFRCVCDDEGRRRLAADPVIEVVEPDLRVTVSSQSIWRHRRQQGGEVVPDGVEAVLAPLVWPSSEGTGVGVAIIDTGVDHNHPDLALNIVGGLNLITPGTAPQDDVGHGTHVAGIVAALRNRLGVVGVAPRARLFPVKVVGKQADGWLSDIIFGLEWVVQQKIPIVNISLSTPSRSRAYERAIRAAITAGVIVVAAVGNEGAGNVDYPAAFPGVIAVGAVGADGRVAPFSPAGEAVTLVAPGVHILSTQLGGGYGYLSGTSMASPHAAGVAALYLQLYSEATPDQVRRALTATAVPIGGVTRHHQGAGRLNAWHAISHQPSAE